MSTQGRGRVLTFTPVDAALRPDDRMHGEHGVYARVRQRLVYICTRTQLRKEL